MHSQYTETLKQELGCANVLISQGPDPCGCHIGLIHHLGQLVLRNSIYMFSMMLQVLHIQNELSR